MRRASTARPLSRQASMVGSQLDPMPSTTNHQQELHTNPIQFFHSLSSCKFPDAPLRPYTPSSTLPSHIVLLADPHVPHPILSHPEESWAITNKLRQAFDELFMRKSWNVVMRLGRVDAVVVVGDMMDVGRGRMGDDE